MTALGYTLDDVIARIRALATNGVAPSLRTYNAQRGPGLPGTFTLSTQGHDWLDLVALAGLEPAKRGAPNGNRNRSISFDQLLTLLEVHERTLTTKRARAAMIRSERKVFNQNRDRLALAMIEAGQEYVCAICKSPGDLTIDHIVPLSAGGQDELDNLRFLCRVCNSRKGNRHETTQ